MEVFCTIITWSHDSAFGISFLDPVFICKRRPLFGPGFFFQQLQLDMVYDVD